MIEGQRAELAKERAEQEEVYAEAAQVPLVDLNRGRLPFLTQVLAEGSGYGRRGVLRHPLDPVGFGGSQRRYEV